MAEEKEEKEEKKEEDAEVRGFEREGMSGKT